MCAHEKLCCNHHVSWSAHKCYALHDVGLTLCWSCLHDIGHILVAAKHLLIPPFVDSLMLTFLPNSWVCISGARFRIFGPQNQKLMSWSKNEKSWNYQFFKNFNFCDFCKFWNFWNLIHSQSFGFLDPQNPKSHFLSFFHIFEKVTKIEISTFSRFQKVQSLVRIKNPKFRHKMQNFTQNRIFCHFLHFFTFLKKSQKRGPKMRTRFWGQKLGILA